jgi:hypothetical protein
MPNTTTLNENIRTLDGTEWVRLATPGANWRAQISAIYGWNQTQGQALTGVNDTNVTLTLGGSPTIALLNASSITLGWTGTLAAGRLNANVVQSVVNDTNVTGSIASQVLTLGWTGTLAVGRGGTGDSTLTANGVLYGNATSAVNVTAAAGANMVLWANSGAPSFTATPVIGTSVTCPLYIGGTAAGSTLTLESTSGAGTSDFIALLTGSQIEAARIDTSQNVNIGNRGAQLGDPTGGTPRLQVSNTALGGIDLREYSTTNTTGPQVTGTKSHNATLGTNTAVTSGEELLSLVGGGYDATGTPVIRQSAVINLLADAAATAGSIPGRVSIATAASGSATPTERVRIDQNGQQYNYATANGGTIPASFNLGQQTTISIANGANSAVALNHGNLIFVNNTSSNECSLYMASGGAVGQGTVIGATWVAPTTTPAAGHQSVAFNGVSTYNIYNNIGSTQTYTVCVIKIGTS